jgi:hypothetical protein
MKLSQAVAIGFEKLIEENDSREIGKFLAYTTEKVIAPEWLKEMCGLDVVPAPDDEEGQQSKYDLLVKDSGLRIQVKFRGGKTLHMEQTRRTTGKNSTGGSKNGQVRYSVDSFDVVLFVIPNNQYENYKEWDYVAIPAEELEDKNMIGYCVGSVSSKLKKKYIGKAIQVIDMLNSL